jgi:hypothetical protein
LQFEQSNAVSGALGDASLRRHKHSAPDTTLAKFAIEVDIVAGQNGQIGLTFKDRDSLLSSAWTHVAPTWRSGPKMTVGQPKLAHELPAGVGRCNLLCRRRTYALQARAHQVEKLSIVFDGANADVPLLIKRSGEPA